MNYTLLYKNIDPVPQVEKLLDKKVQKIDTLLPTFNDDIVALSISFEKHPRKEEYYTALTLTLPRKTLRSKEKGVSLFNSLNLAFDEMIREVKKFKDSLKGEHTYKIRRAEKKQKREIKLG